MKKYFYKVLIICLSILMTGSTFNKKMPSSNIEVVNLGIELPDYTKEDFSYMFTDQIKIVRIAEKEIGNKGGEKFWTWYGCASRISWCAIFVDWCANQLGMIQKDLVPKTASVPTMVRWFENRGLFIDKYQTPEPGMIIFFDLWRLDPLVRGHDGKGDHVGIVKEVKDGYVYTIEGNYSDRVAEAKYPIGSVDIHGYGTPKYE